MKNTMKRRMVLMVGAIALVAVAGGAQGATKLAVQDANQVDKFVVTDTGNIGIGTSAPSMAITIEKPGASGETSIMFHNTGGLPYGQYNSGSFFFMRNNDSSINGGLPKSGDRLGSMSYGSVTSAGYKYGANISALTTSDWKTSPPTYPAFLSFQTTGAAGASPSERMRIDPEGNIGIGTSAPTQKLEVKGGVRLNTTSAKTPTTCDATARGTLWFTQGVAGVADTLEVCAKEAAGTYAWKPLF